MDVVAALAIALALPLDTYRPMDLTSIAGLGMGFYSPPDSKGLDDVQHVQPSRLAELNCAGSGEPPSRIGGETVPAANADGWTGAHITRHWAWSSDSLKSSSHVNPSGPQTTRLQSVGSAPWTTVRAATPFSDSSAATGQNDSFKRSKSPRSSHFEHDQPLLGDVRTRPREYFAVGTVFDMSWVEPSAGPDSRSLGSETLRSIGMTQDSSGNWVYSNPKRFVVIREGSQSCTALPISTYVGKGVSKHGVRKSDHCIVFTGTRPPSPLPAERPSLQETGMLPNAIRVSTLQPVDALDPMSRINFGKVYTVEHRHKVRSFGRVAAGSMPALAMQFKMVWSRLTSSIIAPPLEQYSSSYDQSSRSLSDTSISSITDCGSIRNVRRGDTQVEANGTPDDQANRHVKKESEELREECSALNDVHASSTDARKEAICAAIISVANVSGGVAHTGNLSKDRLSLQPDTANRSVDSNGTITHQDLPINVDELALRELRARGRFRLVDVHSKSVYIARGPVEYCALSYCWGPSDSVTTHRRHLLDDISERNLPAQVQDAFRVVANLGHRYLWLDTICIDQASTTDKQAIIPHMRSIYSNASFTIVGTFGADNVSGGGQFTLFKPFRSRPDIAASSFAHADYANFVQTLSREKDVTAVERLSAFTEAFQRAYSCSLPRETIGVLSGLLPSNFHCNLAWTIRGCGHRVRQKDLTGKYPPSWSWTGWSHEISMDSSLNSQKGRAILQVIDERNVACNVLSYARNFKRLASEDVAYLTLHLTAKVIRCDVDASALRCHSNDLAIALFILTPDQQKHIPLSSIVDRRLCRGTLCADSDHNLDYHLVNLNLSNRFTHATYMIIQWHNSEYAERIGLLEIQDKLMQHEGLAKNACTTLREYETEMYVRLR